MTDRTFSYQPGGWFGIVGEHATVLLPGTEKARAGALWALVDDGAGFDSVLDALVADGLSSLPGFVLLASDGDTTRVVIRGDAEATFEAAEGTVHVAGSGGSMWVERVLHEVSALSVTLAGELPAGPRLRVAGGLVRLASLEAPADTSPSQERPAGASPAPRLELVPDPLTDEIELPPSIDEAPEPESADDGALGEPPSWTPPTAPPPPPTAPPPPPPMPAAPSFPPPPVMPPTTPPPAMPPPPPSPSPAAWDDQPTEQIPAMPAPEPEGDELDEQPEEQEQPDWERPGPVAHLSFSSGDEVDVDGLVVIGRAPDAGRFPAHEAPMIVTVPSPHSEISSTHVEVRPGTGEEHGRAVVTDLGSTNGTLLVQPGRRPDELRPGVPVVLETGALIDLGDGLTIRVTGA